MKLIHVLIATLFVVASISQTLVLAQYTHPLHIVVTFSSLLPDVEQVVLQTDIVEYIVPIGVDPHTYSLKPDDIDKLMRADVIISTGHTGFEKKIRELREEGRISGVLIEIPSIEGINIKMNPETHQPNLHMPIYDPHNYEVFIKKLVKTFTKLNPQYRAKYWKKGNETLEELNLIVKKTEKLNMTAVIETPALQYAVEWLGVKPRYLLMKEHGVAPTPRDVDRIINAINNGTIQLVVVSSPIASKAGEYLAGYAEKHRVPILYVPSPTSPDSILHKLRNISSQVVGILHGFRVGGGVKPPGSQTIDIETITMITGGILIALTITYLVVGRRG